MKVSSQIQEKLESYKALILIVLCLVIVVFVYQSTASEILSLWLKFDESMGHGLLVALTCIFLMFRSKAWRSVQPVRPDFYGVIPLVFAGVLWGVAHVVGINIIQQILMPVLFLSAVLLVLGSNITKQILIPVMFIYFAIPVWDYLNDTLLQITVIVVQALIRWTNITAYIEGSSIFLPSGEILIASGCSGLRYFIVAFFLSGLSAYLYHSNKLIRVLIMLMCVVLALLANWVRVYSITIVAHISDMQSPIVADHETLGWIVFMIFMTPLFFINYRYSQPEEKPDRVIWDGNINVNGRRTVIAVLLLFLSIYTGPAVVKWADYTSHYQLRDIVKSPAAAGGWETSPEKESNFLWRPQFRIPDNYIFQSLSKDNVSVGLFIFPYFKEEKYGDILPYFNTMYDSTTWSLNKPPDTNLSTSHEGIVLNKQYLVNKRTQEKIILVSQYNVGGLTTPSYNAAKLYQIPAVMRKKAYAVITTATLNCDENCTKADKFINDYIAVILRELEHVH